MRIVNVYRRPIPCSKKGVVELIAVLTEDTSGLMAVYLGFDSSDRWIAVNGTKIKYREALSYYPQLKNYQYRD